MSSVSTPNAATKRPDPALLALLFVCAAVATAYVSLAAAGGKLPPTPINLLVLTTLGTTVVCAVVVRVGSQLGAQMSAQHAYANRRMEVLITAMVKQGANFAEVTGEIPRIAPPSDLRGIDPEVIRLGRELTRRNLEQDDL